MIKWKATLFFIIVLALVFGISIGCVFIGRSFVTDENQENNVTSFDISNFTPAENYIGTFAFINDVQKRSYDVLDLLGYDDTYEVSSNKDGILEGSVVTFKNDSTGKKYSGTTITISKDGVNKTYKVVEGYNVFSAKDLYATYSGDVLNSTVYIGGNVVLCADIAIKDIYSKYPTLKNTNCNIASKYGIYGNGHTLSFDGVTTSHTNKLLNILGQDVEIVDTIFLGKQIDSGTSFDLNDLYDIGTLLAFGSDTCNTYADVKNCLFMNSRRNVYIGNSDVSFSGCLFNQASDNNVYIKTNDIKKSNVSFENSVFSSAVISSILSSCDNEVSESFYPNINFSGFVDFYAWKELGDVKVSSEKEEYGEAINALISDSFSDTSFIKNLYKKDGKTYVNMALLVICMNSGNAKNDIIVTGYENINLTKIDVELNAIAKNLLSTSTLYGYTNENTLAINKSIEDNPNLFNEMKNGK